MGIYKKIRRLRLDGVSQRQIAARLHISRNTVKKYWDGDAVSWERKEYSRDASVLTPEVIAFACSCIEEDTLVLIGTSGNFYLKLSPTEVKKPAPL